MNKNLFSHLRLRRFFRRLRLRSITKRNRKLQYYMHQKWLSHERNVVLVIFGIYHELKVRSHLLLSKTIFSVYVITYLLDLKRWRHQISLSMPSLSKRTFPHRYFPQVYITVPGTISSTRSFSESPTQHICGDASRLHSTLTDHFTALFFCFVSSRLT